MIWDSPSTLAFDSLYQGTGPEQTNPITEKGTALGELAQSSGGSTNGGYRGMGLALPALIALLALALGFAWLY